MSDVNTDDFKRTPLAEISSRLNEARYDPTILIKRQIETMEDLTNGQAIIMDPTTPAITLLEMSACMAANNLQETIGMLRAQYPVLAETTEDLYRHMSDDDYLNRFASASTAKMTFGFLLSDIKTKLVYASTEKAYKAIIPRDSRFTVDGVTFTLLYPVVIRRYETGAIQIAYDGAIDNPLSELRGAVITPTIRRSPQRDEWLFFTVDVLQVAYATTHFTLEKTYNFKKTIVHSDQFYYGRAFYRNARTSGAWVEMKTTHTDQVFDGSTPTLIFKVQDQKVQIEIPIIYFSNGTMTGELRVDIYSTKGALSMNLRNYSHNDITVDLTPIDQTRDINQFTNTLADLSYYVYSTETTLGGKRALTMEELRARVIYNAVGPQELPITNVQNTTSAQNKGFEIVKNIDVLTNRTFLATRKLPTPSNPKLITAANIGMVTYAALLSVITANENVISHKNRFTILSKALLKNTNGIVTLLRNHELLAIQAMGQTAAVSHINSNEYFYTPFHYVMDETEPEFALRAYYLDAPYAKDLSFERQNQTLQLFVNTGKYSVEKIQQGYRLSIQTNSGVYYKEIQDSLVGAQLAFMPYGESTYAYINGTLVGRTDSNERLFQFDILTDYELDKNDLLALSNASVSGITDYKAWIGLETRFSIIHYTSDLPVGYMPDATDQFLGKFILNDTMVGNSLEEVTIHFGDALTNLWRKNHSYSLDTVYEKYTADIPLVYEKDVYKTGPHGEIFTIVNGEIVYTIDHHAGEQIYDIMTNEPLYKHRVGDVILNEQLQPIKTVQSITGREMDLLVVDARYYFADDIATTAYRDEIAGTLAGWITGDIADIQKNLLEQTFIYFFPKTTLGDIEVYVENNEQDFIQAEQEFKVSLYVKASIYDDPSIRVTIENATIALLDSYISQSVINMTDVRDRLKTLYGDSVQAFKISGLGGSKDYEIVSMASDKNKLCLKKELTIQSDLTTFVKDAVSFDFRLVQ